MYIIERLFTLNLPSKRISHNSEHLLEDKTLSLVKLNVHRLKVRFHFYNRIRNLIIQRRILIFRCIRKLLISRLTDFFEISRRMFFFCQT